MIQDVTAAELAFLTPEERAQLDELLCDVQTWRPLSGPQTEAYYSKADILLYGGAAGGGKTDLLLGIARAEHRKSVIFRRVFPSLRAIIDRSREIYNPDGRSASRDTFNESLYRWRFADKRQVRFGSCQYDKDITDWQGQPFDLYGWDELTEFTEKQFRFIIGWNRTTRVGQRCRVICTGNPPTNADGEWVIGFWAPWLDETHPNPAKPGELRWFTTVNGKDLELPNGNPVTIDGEVLHPRSRTFIPARVQDNPYLMASGYVAQLQALPEPLRSQMLYGDFRAGRKDDAYQLIPTEWVKLAQARWQKQAKPRIPMSTLGADVARGGDDETVFSARYDNWFDELSVYPGEDTPNGPKVAALALSHCGPGVTVNMDVIGVGSSPFDSLDSQNVHVVAMNASEKSIARDKSGKLGFTNKRAEWYWTLREDLDPASGLEIALPPDPQLRADLCAPRWQLTVRGIQVEAKDDVKKRLGRSPDRGDALVLAHAKPATDDLDFLRAMASR